MLQCYSNALSSISHGNEFLSFIHLDPSKLLELNTNIKINQNKSIQDTLEVCLLLGPPQKLKFSSIYEIILALQKTKT